MFLPYCIYENQCQVWKAWHWLIRKCIGVLFLFGIHSLGCPAVEETEHFLLVIAVALFEETGVLGMDYLAGFIEHDEYGEAETDGVVQALQHGFCELCPCGILILAWIVVHMDIDIVLVDDLADGGIVGDKVGEPETPGTPVATDLANDVFTLGFRLGQGLIDLFDGVDVFVIHLFQCRLCIRWQAQQDEEYEDQNSFHRNVRG